MKKKTLLFIIIAILVLSSAGVYAYLNGYFLGTGIKQCPEAWYDNQMPGISSSDGSQYLIIDGQRREINEFNMQWIRKNCEVNTPTVVS